MMLKFITAISLVLLLTACNGQNRANDNDNNQRVKVQNSTVEGVDRQSGQKMREMIISASRRTDIPAFYSKWFMNRVREGWCLVPNPFNRARVARVSLLREDVEAFAFWTRNPRPLIPRLGELDGRGFGYYFLFTLIGYPAGIDPGSPPVGPSLENFRELCARIGPERVIWRYDPVLFSAPTGVGFHEENFARLAEPLKGFSRRCVISFVENYRKIRGRIEAAIPGGVRAVDLADPAVRRLLLFFVATARQNGMEVRHCAGGQDLAELGVLPGGCIDAELVSRLFSVPADIRKDPGQRGRCGCSVSRDIGMYDTCLFGCSYCYATTSFARARENHALHDPEAPALLRTGAA